MESMEQAYSKSQRRIQEAQRTLQEAKDNGIELDAVEKAVLERVITYEMAVWN